MERMRQTFSQRHGFKPVRASLQVDSIDETTRNRVWNVFSGEFADDNMATSSSIYAVIWHEFLGKSVSELRGTLAHVARKTVEHSLLQCAWHEWFEFWELFLGAWRVSTYNHEKFNYICEQEGVGWRFKAGHIIPLVEPEQLHAIDAVLQGAASNGAKQHIQNALGMIRPGEGHVKAKDVIREAIHAVESQAKHVSKNDKATLGVALNSLDPSMHSALRDAFNKLYGWTSDAKGIRHALLDAPDKDVTIEDALFFVVACSAFVNWLAAKSK